MTTHTPTPWKATPIGQGTGDYCIHAAGIPWQLAYLAENSQYEWPIEANAAFIVRAVNAHDDLMGVLADLEVAEQAIKNIADAADVVAVEDQLGEAITACCRAYRAVKAAA